MQSETVQFLLQPQDSVCSHCPVGLIQAQVWTGRTYVESHFLLYDRSLAELCAPACGSLMVNSKSPYHT